MPRYLGRPTKFKNHILVDTNGTRMIVEATQLSIDGHKTFLLCRRNDNRNFKYYVPLEYGEELPPWLTDTSPSNPLLTSSWQSRKN